MRRAREKEKTEDVGGFGVTARLRYGAVSRQPSYPIKVY